MTNIEQNAVYPLVLDDAGRNLSKRPSQHNDCTVRALTLATGKMYDEVYDELKDKAGRKSHDGIYLYGYLVRRKKFLGVPYTRVKIKKGCVISDVIYTQKGRYLIETYNHVFCVIDGIAHDMIRQPEDEPVEAVWQF